MINDEIHTPGKQCHDDSWAWFEALAQVSAVKKD